ncbi:MAG: hypothetical protein KVP17_004537 [Porospora cf. gigantea B]|nr:MAG: hypothetical protein KVP17_004537 [Porospora cf. gigantea B]
MNPVDNIVALQARPSPGSVLVQIFDLDSMSRLGEFTFGEEVVFWKWCGARFFAVVTTSNVYHWDIRTTDSSPTLTFSRAGQLAESDVQIIDYATNSSDSASAKWALLTCISLKNGVITGDMQLYSLERHQQQFLQGHAGCFGSLVLKPDSPSVSVFCFMERDASNGVNRVHVMDISSPKVEETIKASAEIHYPPDMKTDFPVCLVLSKAHGCLMAVTRGGLIFGIEAVSCKTFYQEKVCSANVFTGALDDLTGGLVFANKEGVVLRATVNHLAIVNAIASQRQSILNAADVASSLASRYGYPSADAASAELLQSLLAQGKYGLAARVVALNKSQALRSTKTVQQFQARPSEAGQPSPVLQLFMTLLEYGRLNAEEAVELVRPVAAQKRRDFIATWVNEGKLQASEELGDIIRSVDPSLALTVYKQAGSTTKVLLALAESGNVADVVQYGRTSPSPVDFSSLIRSTLAAEPEKAMALCRGLLAESPPLVGPEAVFDAFAQAGKLSLGTSLMVDCLKTNEVRYAQLQTKVLEMTLLQDKRTAEALLESAAWNQYDKYRIGSLCERHGMFQRALELYSDPVDVKRVLVQSGGKLHPDCVKSFIGRLAPAAGIEILNDMLRSNRGNMQVVIQCCINYYETLGALNCIEMLEAHNLVDGLFYFLGAIVNTATDPEVVFHYIQAAARMNNMTEVERICRTSTHYEPARVRDFLVSLDVNDPRPLIYVCDLHDFIRELTEYLHEKNLEKFIEVYVTKVNPLNGPQVLGALIDLGAPDSEITNLLNLMRSSCPVGPLVTEMENRNRLHLIQTWLESRQSEGVQDAELHNALAKIYIDTNRCPEEFLNTNCFYNPRVVGQYCEERDPHLAFAAYKKANGTCDRELIALANRDGLFRLQAKYLVERQDLELWAMVLRGEDEFKSQVVDSVVQVALPESTVAEEVSVTVKAFLAADLKTELMELLDRVVLHGNNDFAKHKNLQNLLVMTAIRADPNRVRDYLARLDNYNVQEVAAVCLEPSCALYEEAFLVYNKANQPIEALHVLVTHLGDLERAMDFAGRVDKADVWSQLASVLLRKDIQSSVREAITAYVKANDAKSYRQVVEVALRHGLVDDVIQYLRMVRKTVKDAYVDSELAYCMAKSGPVETLEHFLKGGSLCSKEKIGDRLVTESETAEPTERTRLLMCSKIFFTSANNNTRLAQTLVRLGDFDDAVSSAKKANNPKVWKEITLAAVAAGQLDMAHEAGFKLVMHADHVADVVQAYEERKYFDELIALLEAGTQKHSSSALLTELACVYADYRPDALMAFLESPKLQNERLNVPKLVRACERNELWRELVFVHCTYGEFDQAVHVTLKHADVAWSHEAFCRTQAKVSNTEILYRCVDFYVEQHPDLLVEMLNEITDTVDHGRLIERVRRADRLQLVRPYLESVQVREDTHSVNSALHEMYVEAGDFTSLRKSVLRVSNFDHLVLAQVLESHRDVEFRKVSGILYRSKGRFALALDILNKDEAFNDAIETAMLSRDRKIVADLLTFLVESKQSRQLFAQCLEVCRPYVAPDMALKLAWKAGYTEEAMPFFISFVASVSQKIETLESRVETLTQQVEKKENQQANGWLDLNSQLAITGGSAAKDLSSVFGSEFRY